MLSITVLERQYCKSGLLAVVTAGSAFVQKDSEEIICMSFRNLPEARREENGITYFLREPVTVNGQEYQRYAIQTHFVQRGESYVELVKKYVQPL